MRELPSRLSRASFWVICCALPLGSLAARASSQSVPASLRVCAAESDPGQRLDCYDREMKRLAAPPAGVGKADEPPPAASEAAPPATHQPAAHADLGPSPTTAAAAPPSPAAAASDTPQSPEQEPTTAGRPAWQTFFTGSHLTARIAHLDRWPGGMVLHLDNGQAWRQVGPASGDLGLKAGDSVTIKKRFGSYWLSTDHVSDMRVRLEPPPQ